MSHCNHNECNRYVYKSKEKCILHCKKNGSFYNKDFDEAFYEELCKYIEITTSKELTLKGVASGYANESTVSNYLRSKSLADQKQENTYKFLTEISLIFEGVDFPRIESEFSYFKIFEKIGSILGSSGKCVLVSQKCMLK